MPDHPTKWFAFFAVKEGLLTPHTCREIQDVLGDDMELLLFAEVMIANDLGTVEEVQALVDRAWKKAKNPLPPPKDVFEEPASGVWGVPQDNIPHKRRLAPKAGKEDRQETVEFVLDDDMAQIGPSEAAQDEEAVSETPFNAVEDTLAVVPAEQQTGADDLEVPAGALEGGDVTPTEVETEEDLEQPLEAPAELSEDGAVLEPTDRDLDVSEGTSPQDRLDSEVEGLLAEVEKPSQTEEIREVASKTKEVLRSKILAALQKSKDTDSPPKLSQPAEPVLKEDTVEESLQLDTSHMDLSDLQVDFQKIAQMDRDAIKLEVLKLLKGAQKAGASDLHLSANSAPFIRGINGISFLVDHVLTADESRLLNTVLLSRTQETFFVRRRDYDYALNLADGTRFRVNLKFHKDGPAGVYHLLPSRIQSLDELGFRNADVIRAMLEAESGLLLVAGPANSGKTSTVAAIVAELNDRRNDHIVSIESPIEIVHDSGNSNVTQREVGVNTDSFAAALKSAMRQDAGVIVLGDLVDLETAELATFAADTGRLVVACMPAMDVPSALNRLLHAYPEPQQTHLRAMIADALRGVIGLRLLPNRDGARTVACEVLVNNLAVANLIRRGKTHGLKPIMEAGVLQGMCTLDQYVLGLFQDGIISEEVATQTVTDRAVKNRIRSQTRFGNASAQAMQGMLPGQKASKQRWGVFSGG